MEEAVVFLRWWGPWLFLAVIPGAVNLVVASRQLGERCKYLPFFRPTRLAGFWIWALTQFLAPSVLYWLSMGLQARPDFTWASVGKAFGFGLGFIALMNARTQLDRYQVNIQPIYAFFVQIAYSLIAGAETSRTAQYRTALEAELTASKLLPAGIAHLINYFESDIALSPEEQTRRVKQLEALSNKLTTPPKLPQIKALIALIEVRRKDLREMLLRFDCQSAFLDQYFPRS
jgi:hypothetical protein